MLIFSSKGWLIDTLSEPFGTLWKVQICIVCWIFLLSFTHDRWTPSLVVSPGFGTGSRSLPWVSCRTRGYLKACISATVDGILHRLEYIPCNSYVAVTVDNHIVTYCPWTKSCTTKDDDYPIIYRVLTIPGGCLGFRPPTVVTTSRQLRFHLLWIRKTVFGCIFFASWDPWVFLDWQAGI